MLLIQCLFSNLSTASQGNGGNMTPYGGGTTLLKAFDRYSLPPLARSSAAVHVSSSPRADQQMVSP